MSEARMAAVNLEELTKVVVLAEPFQLTVDPLTKPVPVTVSVNAGPPGAAASGLRGFKKGTELVAAATAGITNATASKETHAAHRWIRRFIIAPLWDLESSHLQR